LGSDDPQTKEESAKGCGDVTGQEDRQGEEMEPEVEIDELVGLGEIDFFRVSLYLEDLFLWDFRPFLNLHN
jgi:hypothetical protein